MIKFILRNIAAAAATVIFQTLTGLIVFSLMVLFAPFGVISGPLSWLVAFFLAAVPPLLSISILPRIFGEDWTHYVVGAILPLLWTINF